MNVVAAIQRKSGLALFVLSNIHVTISITTALPQPKPSQLFRTRVMKIQLERLEFVNSLCLQFGRRCGS